MGLDMKPIWPSHYVPPRRSGVEIIETVARRANCSVATLKSKDASPALVDARSAACVLLRRQGISYPVIARMMGRADHSTVMHSIQNFERYADRSPWLRELVA